MKALVLGSLNTDFVYRLDHIVKNGETISANTINTFPGGKGLNQSVALAKAGVDVYHAGLIGKDGEFLLKFLRENSVNTKFIDIIEEKTGHAIIQVDTNGENSILLYGGANKKITSKYIDYVLSNFGEGDFLILQNEINKINEIIEKAYERKMTIVFNPAPMEENVKNISFSKLDYLILNETELKTLSNENDIEKGKEFLKLNFPNLNVILTLGSKGSIYINEEREIKQEIYKVDAVDTTAAGDTFIGFFVAGLIKNYELKKSLSLASAAAAISVTFKGAATSIPTIIDAEKFLREYKGDY